MKSFTASAPGKVIISGEHAVVSGAPAIVIPTDKTLTVEITKRCDKTINIESDKFGNINFQLSDLAQTVLDCTDDFILILHTILRANKIKIIQHGLDINIASKIEVGCGFGSSAALIVATLKAFIKMQNIKLSDQETIKLATEIENIQHAKSSGIDVKIAFYASDIFYSNASVQFKFYHKSKIKLIQTGARQCTTAESVLKSQEYFKNHPDTLAAFSAVTNRIDRALSDEPEQLASSIHYNQLLLNKIGVTPKKIMQFIAAAHKLGIAMKVSGAGAVTGDNAGILVAIDHPALDKICNEYGYRQIEL
jgi:mevalonate kinase